MPHAEDILRRENRVTTFKPMLAKDADLAKLKFPLIVQPKLDGIRATVVNGALVSRTLKLIPNREIQATLACPEFEGLDGELIVGEPTADDCYRRTTSFVMAQNKTGEPWYFFVFDKWDAEGGPEDRYAEAQTVVNRTLHADDPIFMVAQGVADNASELERMEEILIEGGYEGVIARVPGSAYKFGRSGKTGPLLKIKRYIDFEAAVIGVYEEMHNTNVAMTNALGRTERSSARAGLVGKGTLGGLILRALNGPAEGVEFRCGTGFDAEQRAALWMEARCPHGLPPLHATTEGLNGRVAKVKSFPIGVKDKPRHPVFLGWRDMEIDG